MEASLRNLEIQVGQIANQLFERPYGNLPSNTEKNLREEVNAITLRNGRKIKEAKKESRDKGKKAAIESSKLDESESFNEAPK